MFQSLTLLLFSSVVESHRRSSCYTFAGTVLHTLPGALPQCSYMVDRYDSCTAVPTQSLDSCVCDQKLFNAIYECQNEEQLCLDSENLGPGLSGVVSAWHKQCDDYINFSATTPSLVSLQATYNSEACTAVDSACQIGTSIAAGCLSSYTASDQTAQLNSCFCQERAISAASVCEYDGNKTCLGSPAAYSDIGVWKVCPNQASSFLAHATTDSAHGGQTTLPALPGGRATSHASMSSLGATTPVTTGAQHTSTSSGRRLDAGMDFFGFAGGILTPFAWSSFILLSFCSMLM